MRLAVVSVTESGAMDLGLRGHAVLVAGAAGGIGRAVTEMLAAEGARVRLIDRDAEALSSMVAVLTAQGVDAVARAADVTSEPEVRDAMTDLAAGGLDAVVGCVGISGPVGNPFFEVSRADWLRVLDTNVTSAFLLLSAALPALRRSRDAAVVLVGSDSARVASPGMAPYCASKAALVQFARAASVDLQDDGIRVNTVSPSIVDTPMSRNDLGIEPGFPDVPYPVQTAQEVATQVVFLVSPRSRPVNGADLIADFGFSARSNFPA